MVFFQAALLLGYLYAHALSTRVAPRAQWAVHAALLIAASLVLPLSIDAGQPGGGDDPRGWLLRTLTLAVGLPFFALAATAPLLQRWFSRTADRRAADPYFLYAASNAGSLLGLVGYLAAEPVATRRTQAAAWTVTFWAVAALIAACGFVSLRSARGEAVAPREDTVAAVPLAERALWIALALAPSALLVGVTQHLATDVVSVPLLWTVPLALYLTTFVAAFSPRVAGSASRWGTPAALLVFVVLVLTLGEVRYPVLGVALLHLAALTVLAMTCHTRLAERRPHPSQLTAYFVCISLGGVLGGAAAALVAPNVFTSILEYPLAIAAALLLSPRTIAADRGMPSRRRRLAWRGIAVLLAAAGYWMVAVFDANAQEVTGAGIFRWAHSLSDDAETAQRIARVAFAIPAAVLLLSRHTALLFAGAASGLLVAAAVVRTGGEVLARERTFFGVHQVSSIQGGEWHVLTHGTTTHGLQAVRGKRRMVPTAYYHPSGPIGDVVFTLAPEGRLRNVAVVGLGAGALAAYAGNGVHMDVFEIDEAVIRIAEEPRFFTYLEDAKARPGVTIRTAAVDGRLGLRAAAASYDLIVIDAFSSDAIPTHLITREAVAEYESRLAPQGVLAFHISSRFFDLAPVLARIAVDRNLVAYIRRDEQVPPERSQEAMLGSVWVVLARQDRDLGQLAQSAPRWTRLAADAGDPLWTDDYTNIFRILQ